MKTFKTYEEFKDYNNQQARDWYNKMKKDPKKYKKYLEKKKIYQKRSYAAKVRELKGGEEPKTPGN